VRELKSTHFSKWPKLWALLFWFIPNFLQYASSLHKHKCFSDYIVYWWSFRAQWSANVCRYLKNTNSEMRRAVSGFLDKKRRRRICSLFFTIERSQHMSSLLPMEPGTTGFTSYHKDSLSCCVDLSSVSCDWRIELWPTWTTWHVPCILCMRILAPQFPYRIKFLCGAHPECDLNCEYCHKLAFTISKILWKGDANLDGISLYVNTTTDYKWTEWEYDPQN
jgi:hypothetical protein